MPYIGDRDFAEIRELLETIQELAERKEHLFIPDIAVRALKVIRKYIVEPEEEK